MPDANDRPSDGPSDGPTDASLAATRFLDWTTPSLQDFAVDAAGDGTDRDKAVRLCHAVRDRIRYDPYSFRLAPEIYVASHCLDAPSAYCVPKAILLAAAARAVGIPSRVGFADVRNHLSSPKLTAMMGTDVFRWHGYTLLWLDGRWVKATPAFDIGLCTRFGIAPLDFDGVHDSIYHPFDSAGRQHMEYVADRGGFDDVPFDIFVAGMRTYYAPMLEMLEAQDRAGARMDDTAFGTA
ncbi:transglutaminase-like domain-containing protein [Chachezhania sediminis]|uniref:transglutaminase-like domain-containing protein n=1 Tax=Chachezhania sediminis TaxID=2599291 RepID=UPI00131E3BD0|nr:transglutaminase family protein [Chachezhania sediminis]